MVLADTGEDRLAAALDRLARVLDRGIPRGFFKPEDKLLALARIATTVALDPFATCDFVTEAVFEDEAVKAETYKKLDADLPAPLHLRQQYLDDPDLDPRLLCRRGAAAAISSARIISRRPRA